MGLNDEFKFDGPLTRYNATGTSGAFNTTQELGVRETFVQNALTITAPAADAGYDEYSV